MGSSRLLYVLTREGNLPKWCAKISLRTGAPIGAISVLGSLAIVSAIIVLSYELELLAAVIGSSIVCFVYAAFMLAVIRLRKTQPNLKRPFKTAIFPWVQWLIIIFMPLMGIQSLFSLPDTGYVPIYGMIVFIILALLLTRWSLLLSARNQSSKLKGASFAGQQQSI
jgi:amino acid transporter